MKIKLTNMPKLKLQDLLRRRKMTLVTLLEEFGITTYEGLKIKCDRMGVVPPPETDFTEALPVKGHEVNNPQDGVIVVEALPDAVTAPAKKPEKQPEVVHEDYVPLPVFSVAEPVVPDVKAEQPVSGSAVRPTDLVQKRQQAKKDANQGKQ